jgi:hypothetical protein
MSNSTRDNAAPTVADVERFADGGRNPSLIEASLRSARSINNTMTGVIQPQINAHSTQIATAQGQITQHGEAIASATTLLQAHSAAVAAAQAQLITHGEAIAEAKARLDAQNETLTGALARLTVLGELTALVMGEDSHIGYLRRDFIELVGRIARLEENPRPHDTPHGRPAPDEAREMREAIEALRERFTPIESAISQMRARGPQGGNPRTPRR